MAPMTNPLPPRCAQRFEPVRMLARGGHGEIWLATERALDRPAVVKLLRQGVARVESDLLERFRNEARVTALLSHPGIVVLLDHDVEEGGAWIAYEYVASGSLADVLESRGPLSWQRALDVVRQVAEVLAIAHASGVVHRDVKPANILVAGEDHYKLADFGIAHWSELSGKHTLDGQVLGSPAYLAPEARFGAAASPAADVFALGISAIQLITGEIPQSLLAGPDAPRFGPWIELRKRTPEAVAQLIERTTAPVTAQRVGGARELARLSAQLLDADAESSVVARRTRRADKAAAPRHTLNMRAPHSVAPTARTNRMALVAWMTAGLALGLTAALIWTGAPERTGESPPPSAAPSTSVEEEHVRLLREVRDTLERAPITLSPWHRGDSAQAGGWPLVLACQGHIQDVVLRPSPDARVRSIDGRAVESVTGAPVRLAPSLIRPGVLFVEVDAPPDRRPTVTVEVRRGPCNAGIEPHRVPPSLALLADELRRRFFEMDDGTVAAVRALVDRELSGRDEVYRRSVLALIDLREAAFWNQRFSQQTMGEAFMASVDAYWTGDTLALARRTMLTVESLLPAARDPATGWLEIGSILRLCHQPDAARAALVESLRAWPESHWAWFELAELETGLGTLDQDPPLSVAQREAHLTLSLSAYDVAARLMRQRFARRRDDERFWLATVQSSRSDAVRAIGRLRETRTVNRKAGH